MLRNAQVSEIKKKRAVGVDGETIRKMQNTEGKVGENAYYGQR